jgi:magnesium-transporting ATPase (P-type)
MGSGTDIVKPTVDIIITDDDSSTVVAAIEQGRSISRNDQ